MVQITPEEVMEMRRKQATPDDPIRSWERELLKASARVDIPLDSPHLLRKVAPILAGLAAHIEFTSKRTDLSEFDILMSIQGAVRGATKQIRQLHGGALPNGPYPKKQ